MPRPSLFYRLTALLLRAALPVVAVTQPRLRRMLAERREVLQRINASGTKQPTILLHAASAGELRQLEPIVRRLRTEYPATQLAVTWFSTSGAPVGNALGADLAGALPWDTPWETGNFLDRLKPSLIVVGKLDLWPELSWQAERRKIPVVLVAATVRRNSSRLDWPTRWILAPAYASLTAVGAISDHDAQRLVRLGVPRTRITITGDPRYDSVVERPESAPPVPRDPSLLVAGSTWPVDELLILKAFAEVRAKHPSTRLLIVPHQPTPAGLERITGIARELHLPVPGADLSSPASLVVDMTIGGLALSYRAGALAYVAGGFNGTGPHSVIEPAATGVPVVIGSMSTTHEAFELEAVGGLTRLDNDAAVVEMAAWWIRMLDDPAAAAAAGAAAKQMVEKGRGAADRSVELIRAVMEKGERSG